MTQPTDKIPEPNPAAGTPTGASLFEVEETAPDGSRPDAPTPVLAPSPIAGAQPDPAPAELPAPEVSEPEVPELEAAMIAQPAPDDDEEPPQLSWYVLKVQSGREDTIRDALERRVKIQGLGRYFGRIVVPTEKTTEIRNNKKRVVERKSYPGYIMVEMELNEKTWFVVRETPGVGDFVGAHGTPTKMIEAEVNQMLGQQTAAETEQVPKVRIDVERGDRVKIKDGPFENFEGTVEEVIEARGLVKVMLIIFNRPTPVDLEYWQVERI
jgi:transcriptional antiterminator NusG